PAETNEPQTTTGTKDTKSARVTSACSACSAFQPLSSFVFFVSSSWPRERPLLDGTLVTFLVHFFTRCRNSRSSRILRATGPGSEQRLTETFPSWIVP